MPCSVDNPVEACFFLEGNVGRVDLGEREGDGGALGVVGGRQEKTVIRI